MEPIEEMKPVPVSTKPGSGYIQGYTVLAKSMMGAGLLGIAAACSKLGWVLGITFSILIPVISTVSMSLLARVALETPATSGPATFYNMSNRILGKWPSVFIEIVLILKTFGASIVYLQVAGDMLALIIVSSSDQPLSISQANISRLVQVGLALVFYPFCLLRSISKTFIINTIGIACLLFITATSFIYFDPSGVQPSPLWPQSVAGALSKIPVYLFAYCCHQNVFPIVDDIGKESAKMKKLNLVFTLASVTGFLVYTPVMVLPFISFGTSVQDNFLRNLPPQDIVTKMAYIAASLSVSISFPLQVVPLRNAIIGLSNSKNEKLRIWIATAAVVAALGIAVSGAPLGIVMAITGLIGGNTIVFLTPSWLYWKSHTKKSNSLLWISSWAIFVFSILLYPLCLVGIILAK
jgi:amino acid permease